MSKQHPPARQNRSPADRSPLPDRPFGALFRRSTLGPLALGLGLAIYALAFFWQPLLELSRHRLAPIRRLDIFILLFTDATSIWSDRWFAGGDWRILDRLPIVAAAAFILALAYSIGSAALRMSGADRRLTALEQFVFSLGCGLNILSLVTLGLGLAGAIHSRSAVLFGGAAILAAAACVHWRSRRARQTPNTPPPAPAHHWPTAWLLLLGAPFVAVTLLGGMLPASDFDVREYHLQAPKEFFLAGQITFVPHNVYANMPLGTEMHSLLGMMILDDWWHGALVGKLVQACFLPLAGLALWAAGRRWESDLAGQWAAVIFVSTPWIVHVASAGLVEGAAAFYLCAALFALLHWRSTTQSPAGTEPPPHQAEPPVPPGTARRTSEPAARQRATSTGALLMAGFLAGSAVATKYPAALFVVAPLAALVGWWARGRRVRSLAIFLVAVAVACGPWLLKNACLTGNPTYPLLYEVFGGASWSPEKNIRWNAAHRPEDFAVVDRSGSIPRDLAESLTDVFLRSPWLNFVTWPLALAALWAVRRQPLVGLLWGYVLFVLVAWWLLTHRIDRFWVPVLSIASLLAGIGACLHAARAWQTVAAAALAIALAYDFTLVATNTGPGSSNRFFAPLQRLRQDPERIPIWQIWLNVNTPPGKQVLAEGDAALFDLEMPVTYHTAFDASPLVALIEGKSAQQRRAALRPFAFVYVNWNEIGRYRSPGNYGFAPQVTPELFDELLRQQVLAAPVAVWPDAGVLIYPVR